MSGMEPMLIGAALGGGISAARGGNPLKGALLGAVGGGIGGAAMNVANPAMTATMTGASAVPVGTTAGAALPAAVTPAVSSGFAGGGYGSIGAAPAASGIFAQATNPVFAATGGSTGLIPSITAPATLMDQIGAATKFAKENPFQMNLASNIVQQNAQEDAQRLAEMRARSGLMTGKQIPQTQPISSFGVPQLSLM